MGFDDYNCNAVVNITGQSGAGVDHQVRFTVGRSSGQINLGGFALSFPHDLRFFAGDKVTALNYYIEDITEDPVVVWVQIKSNLDTNQFIYVCFGKAGDTTTSDYVSTFPWITQTVDSIGGEKVGSHCSLALDSKNYPHIAYLYSNHVCAKYAKWTGSAWSNTILRDWLWEGFGTSIAIDASDRPVILYFSQNTGALTMARWNGSTWVYKDSIDAMYSSTSESTTGFRLKLLIDGDGKYHAVYGRTTTTDLGYAYSTNLGVDWTAASVNNSQNYTNRCLSMALDANKYPHLLTPAKITSGSVDNMRYVWWDGADWQTTPLIYPIIACPFAYTGCCITINPATGYPIIAYREGNAENGLDVLEYDGEDWNRTEIDPGSGLGEYSIIQFDSRNRKYIGYKNTALKMASKLGDSWTIESVDSGGDWAYMCLDSYGFPQIAYASGFPSSTILRHAYRRKFCYPEPAFSSMEPSTCTGGAGGRCAAPPQAVRMMIGMNMI
jgi:hypothetical protein